MSWLEDLSGELYSRGVTRRDRVRIVAELSDHIACEPGCEERLGDPRMLAGSFADELATAKARTSAFAAFAALALAAIVLIVSQITLARFAHYPGYSNGISPALFLPAIIGMLVAPQVALVAGTLAAWRALRRRRVASLPAEEIALIHRRTRVALAAGFATMAGLELYVVDFSERLPAWWLGLTGALAATAGAGLWATARTLSRARTIVSGEGGSAGDIFEDLPVLGWSWLRSRPWLLGALASLTVGLAIGAFEAHAEHSVAEGIQRGGFEGVAAALGFVLLGRAVGARPPRA
ncbi:MAG TPA: hypothetical protein VMA76_09515 [Solirubrobacteraceae bacterium]|nr:hypothetical protein [Solirubrobacteraceae bacterium]